MVFFAKPLKELNRSKTCEAALTDQRVASFVAVHDKAEKVGLSVLRKD